MAGYLPGDQIRCSAYWYSARAGLPCDLDSLLALGLAAWRLAVQRYGLVPWRVPEGPYWVNMWPGWIWAEVTDAFRDEDMNWRQDPYYQDAGYGTDNDWGNPYS